MRLNEAQDEAVHYVHGPCLVLAGAGSGKTRVITEKIVNLYQNHRLPPQSICAVTFTNKAAQEMRERVAGELGAEVAKKVWISTFHSLGLEFVHLEHKALGIARNFTLFDERDQFKVVRDLIRSEHSGLLSGDKSEKDVIYGAINDISRYKSELKTPDMVEKTAIGSILYQEYQDYLRACAALDFDDLIFLMAKSLSDDPQLRLRWSKVFNYVLVDEYQDTNETQYKLLRALTSRLNCFTVVGDDDQSIYSWRGARPENIRVLADDYPDLKVIKLEQNYRSSSRILRCANALIANNPHLFSKTLRSALPEGPQIKVLSCPNAEDEAQAISVDIKSLQYEKKLRYSDFAVLYRSNFQSRAISDALNFAGIPCVVLGGTGLFDLLEVKDMLAYCRLICNLRDNTSLVRIINVPRRGIGAQTLKVIAQKAQDLNCSLFEACMAPDLELTGTQLSGVKDFVALMTKLRTMLLKKEDLALARNLLAMTGYETYVKVISGSKASADGKMRDLRKLMSIIEEYIKGTPGQSNSSFAKAVDRIGLREMQEKKRDDDGADAVQLMTMHSSKGLEFPYVYIAGMEEDILPHKTSLEEGNVEEERRLAYVGITRAQKVLSLSYCRQRRNRNEIKLCKPSRFIDELPQADLLPLRHEDQKRVEDDRQRQMANLAQASEALRSLLK